MTCIKTGARVYLENYNDVVAADLHDVGDCIVIVYNPRSFGHYKVEEATHRVGRYLDATVYQSDHRGMLVVPDDYIEEVNNAGSGQRD